MSKTVKKICVKPYYMILKSLIITLIMLSILIVVYIDSTKSINDYMAYIFMVFIFILIREIITFRYCIILSNQIETIKSGFLDSTNERFSSVEEKNSFIFGKIYKFHFQYRTISINQRMFSKKDFISIEECIAKFKSNS